MGVEKSEILYVGDDPGPDIYGALDAGIQPVWTTYAQNMNVRHVADLAYAGLPSPDGRVPRIGSWEDLLALLG
jgi:FMN phosphatase YigB (HAD superfamily)